MAEGVAIATLKITGRIIEMIKATNELSDHVIVSKTYTQHIEDIVKEFPSNTYITKH